MTSNTLKIDFSSANPEIGSSVDILSLAQQAAHDIRSPLSVLNILLKCSLQMPDESRAMAQDALKRISGIANDLLVQGRSQQQAGNKPEQIALLVAQIVSEKKLLVQDMAGVEIEFDDSRSLEGACYMNRGDLQRVISNLLNNAIEAFESRNGKIKVTVVTSLEQLQIRISDNGKGIPQKHLSLIGQKGFSYGKKSSNESGFGLGLSHAMSTVESMGGELIIESLQEVGTTVTIILPRVG